MRHQVREEKRAALVERRKRNGLSVDHIQLAEDGFWQRAVALLPPCPAEEWRRQRRQLSRLERSQDQVRQVELDRMKQVHELTEAKEEELILGENLRKVASLQSEIARQSRSLDNNLRASSFSDDLTPLSSSADFQVRMKSWSAHTCLRRRWSYVMMN